MGKTVKVLGVVALVGAAIGGVAYAIHKLNKPLNENYISPDKSKDTEDIESILSGKCKCGDGNCEECNCGDECVCGDCECEDCDCEDYSNEDEESIGDFKIPSEEDVETSEETEEPEADM